VFAVQSGPNLISNSSLVPEPSSTFQLFLLGFGRIGLTYVFRQSLLQTITTSVDVSTTSSVIFTPDGTIGPNGNE
jgi:hypothetical protein